MIFAKEGNFYYSPCAKREIIHIRGCLRRARGDSCCGPSRPRRRTAAGKESLSLIAAAAAALRLITYSIFLFLVSCGAIAPAITHRNKVTNNACVTRKCIKIHAAYIFSTHKREWEKEVGAGCLIEVAPWEIFFGQISKMLLTLIIILYPGEELQSHRLETLGRKRCACGSRDGIRKQRRPTFPLAANSLAGNNYMMNANYICARIWSVLDIINMQIACLIII